MACPVLQPAVKHSDCHCLLVKCEEKEGPGVRAPLDTYGTEPTCDSNTQCNASLLTYATAPTGLSKHSAATHMKQLVAHATSHIGVSDAHILHPQPAIPPPVYQPAPKPARNTGSEFQALPPLTTRSQTTGCRIRAASAGRPDKLDRMPACSLLPLENHCQNQMDANPHRAGVKHGQGKDQRVIQSSLTTKSGVSPRTHSHMMETQVGLQSPFRSRRATPFGSPPPPLSPPLTPTTSITASPPHQPPCHLPGWACKSPAKQGPVRLILLPVPAPGSSPTPPPPPLRHWSRQLRWWRGRSRCLAPVPWLNRWWYGPRRKCRCWWCWCGHWWRPHAKQAHEVPHGITKWIPEEHARGTKAPKARGQGQSWQGRGWVPGCCRCRGHSRPPSAPAMCPLPLSPIPIIVPATLGLIIPTPPPPRPSLLLRPHPRPLHFLAHPHPLLMKSQHPRPRLLPIRPAPLQRPPQLMINSDLKPLPLPRTFPVKCLLPLSFTAHVPSVAPCHLLRAQGGPSCGCTCRGPGGSSGLGGEGGDGARVVLQTRTKNRKGEKDRMSLNTSNVGHDTQDWSAQ